MARTVPGTVAGSQPLVSTVVRDRSASASGLLPQSELDDMRRMLTNDQYQQELECSFEAAVRGAIYRDELAEMST